MLRISKKIGFIVKVDSAELGATLPQTGHLTIPESILVIPTFTARFPTASTSITPFPMETHISFPVNRLSPTISRSEQLFQRSRALPSTPDSLSQVMVVDSKFIMRWPRSLRTETPDSSVEQSTPSTEHQMAKVNSCHPVRPTTTLTTYYNGSRKQHSATQGRGPRLPRRSEP